MVSRNAPVSGLRGGSAASVLVDVNKAIEANSVFTGHLIYGCSGMCPLPARPVGKLEGFVRRSSIRDRKVDGVLSSSPAQPSRRRTWEIVLAIAGSRLI